VGVKNLKERLQFAHEELADMYRASPFVTVKNSRTEALWREIDRLEILLLEQAS
jgi:hypothetical protein